MIKHEKVAIGWFQGGVLKILKRKKSIDGIVRIDKNNAVLIPDETTPRLIKLIKWFPLPSAKWYPFYLANPEHALSLEMKFRKKESRKLSFRGKDNPEPIYLENKQEINVTEAIPTLIEPRLDINPEDKTLKYGLETMSAENLSTFMEGKQESMLARTTTDKFNMIIYILLGAVIGFLMGQVLPLAPAVAT